MLSENDQHLVSQCAPQLAALRSECFAPTRETWCAILLAGQRPGIDPLAERFGLDSKANVPIHGKPMWTSVLSTLLSTPGIGKIIVLAQDRSMVSAPGLEELIDGNRVVFAESTGGIAQSISHVIGTSIVHWPVLITTADHPLLTAEMVSEFIEGAGASDLAVAAVERRTVMRRYPLSRRTWLKFRGGAFSGANLFALRSPATSKALELWTKAEQDRKHALKLFWHFGPVLALRGIARTISFPAALHAAGQKLGLNASLVLLRQAEAAIDVDKMSDYVQVEAILANRDQSHSVDRPEDVAIKQAVAIFDLDRTLTKRPTYTALLAFLAWRIAPWKLLTAPLVLLAMLGYLCKLYSRQRVKEIEHWLLLGGGVKRAVIERETSNFADRLDATGFFAEGRAAITRAYDAGNRVILATAANQFYASELARRLGIYEVVATGSVWKNDKLTAKIDGANCYGQAKLEMMTQYLNDQGLERGDLHISFYSDHISDRPMFDWADEKIAVNPSAKLFEHALLQNWLIKFWT